jgi:hypothetical protein
VNPLHRSSSHGCSQEVVTRWCQKEECPEILGSQIAGAKEKRKALERPQERKESVEKNRSWSKGRRKEVWSEEIFGKEVFVEESRSQIFAASRTSAQKDGEEIGGSDAEGSQ